MKILLINPRGRVVEVDDKEVNLQELIYNGFSLAPDGVEAGKAYNPVYDRGEYTPPPIDTRAEKPAVSGDILKVVRV